MDDVWARLAVVGGLAVLLVLWARLRRRPASERSVFKPGLPPGVYLFTSRTCGDCEQARRELTERTAGFREIEWEVEPTVFEELAITRVPSTLVVAPNGSGVWTEGVPESPGNP